MAFDHLREEYAGTPLDEAEVASDPIEQLRRWMSDAEAADVDMANAMTLATVGADRKPSARIVLLKDLTPEGLSFFSNYDSRKGRELEDNPFAAAVFYWQPLSRQVRVEGSVVRLGDAESDAYFTTRPRESNLSAIASAQSNVVSSRAVLEERLAKVASEIGSADLQRPPHWGGYRLLPTRFEFWQGRENRLHDRLQYEIVTDISWTVSRLFP